MSNTSSITRKAPWFKLMIRIWINSWLLKADRLKLFGVFARSGNIVRVLGRTSDHYINTPEAISHILVKNESNYTKVGTAFGALESFVGPGLLSNSGEAWQCTRLQTQRQFYHKHIVNMLPTVSTITEKLLDDWSLRQGETLNIAHEMSKLVIEISAKLFFGADIHQDTDKAVQAIQFTNWYIMNSFFSKYRVPTPKNRRFHSSHRIIDALIQKMLKPPHPTADPTAPILQCFWNQPDHSPEEHQRIHYEAKNFFVASHEGTATSLGWIIYLLSKNPSIFKAMLQEIDTVFDGNVPTVEQLDELPLTTMVIEETIRLYPPAWIIERRLIEDDIVEGYRIPANSTVFILPYTLHRNPKYWTNPEEFNPQRFNKNNPHAHPKSAYIPFSIGPRVCIGKHLSFLMIKTILCRLFQRFELTVDPSIEVDVNPLMTLKPDGPIPFRLQRRNLN